MSFNLHRMKRMSGLGRTSEGRKKKPTPFSFPPRDAHAQGGTEAWQTFWLVVGGKSVLPCLLEDPSQQVPSLQRKEWEEPGRATAMEPGSEPAQPGLACWAPGGLSSFPQPVGQQPGPCAPLSPCPSHSSAYSGSTVASRALLGQEKKQG